MFAAPLVPGAGDSTHDAAAYGGHGIAGIELVGGGCGRGCWFVRGEFATGVEVVVCLDCLGQGVVGGVSPVASVIELSVFCLVAVSGSHDKEADGGAERDVFPELGFVVVQPAIEPDAVYGTHVYGGVGAEVDLGVRTSTGAVGPWSHDEMGGGFVSFLQRHVGLSRAGAEEVVPATDHEDGDIFVLVDIVDDVTETPEFVVSAVFQHIDDHVFILRDDA